MKLFFQQILPQFFRAKGVPEPDLNTPRETTQPKSFAPVQAPAIASPPALAAMAVRRPLISANGDVAGFEFRVDGEALKLLRKSADVNSISAYIAMVLIAARLVALEGRIGFARLPAAWLVYAAVPKNEPGTWIGVEWDADERLTPDMQIAMAGVVHKFRTAGAKLAWEPSLDLGGLICCLISCCSAQRYPRLIRCWTRSKPALPC